MYRLMNPCQQEDEGADEIPEKKVVFDDDDNVEDIDLESFGKKKKKKKKREGLDMEELKVKRHTRRMFHIFHRI